jgi:hypothetical protein
MNNLQRPHLFGMLAGLFLAAGLAFSSMMATTAWLKIRNSQYITVKGSARKNVKADLAIWRGTFVTEAPTLLEAQRQLKVDRDTVARFLQDSGMATFTFTPIAIEELKASLKDTNGFVQLRVSGFRLAQTVRVDSNDPERIGHLDSESTELVEKGVQFTTQPPEFIYTKAGEAKIEMLAEATKDARSRGEQIAAQGGRNVARLHDADMGIFQITPLYSGQTSWEGMNDVSSLEKTITAVVTASFELK